MSLLSVVLVLIVVGILLWLLNTYGTMIDGKIKQIINIVVVIAVIIWLLQLSGILGSVDVPFPRVR
jgi:hypothetical protein